MWEMSRELDVQNGTLSRWVKQWKLDLSPLPPSQLGGKARGSGYNLPTEYTLVGRGWKLTTDKRVRELMLRILPTDPKPFLVVVADVGIACYDAEQATQEVARILASEAIGIPETVSVFHVGDPPTKR